MPDPPPKPELLPSLRRLVRGLSALFWGLPCALVLCFYTAKTEGFKFFGVGPPLVSTAWLAYGLWQLGAFQKQERVWRHALDRAQLLGLINLGLSPFLYWSNQAPANPFFLAMTLTLSFVGPLFLAALNLVLQRLAAMLPDEALRQEVKQFTRLNLRLLAALLAFVLLYLAFAFLPPNHLRSLPPWVLRLLALPDRSTLWYFIPLIPGLLLPMAMTMALLWKTKEVILDGVFRDKLQPPRFGSRSHDWD